MSTPVARMNRFFGGVREEMRQVSWPTRDELIGSSVVVFVGVVVLALYISCCDFFLSHAAQRLLR